MTIKFHFRHEGGVPHGTIVPTNFLFLYQQSLKEKRIGIIQALCCLLLCVFLLCNTFFCYLPIMNGQIWVVIFCSAIALCAAWLYEVVFWKGPLATLFFVVMNTEGFIDYINMCREQMGKMLDPVNMTVSFLPYKEAKKITKELMTAEIIRQLVDECNQISDPYEAINFIADNCENLRGFTIKEVKQHERTR